MRKFLETVTINTKRVFRKIVEDAAFSSLELITPSAYVYIRAVNCFVRKLLSKRIFYMTLAMQSSPLLRGYAEHFVLQPKNSNVKFYVLAYPLVEICNAVVE